MMRENGRTWILLIIILAGIVLGNFIGARTENIPMLSWLNYSQSFGLNNPIVLDVGIIVLTFGIKIKISIASILGLAVSAIIYRFL